MANFHTQLEKSKNINEIKISNDLFDYIRSISEELTELNVKQLNEDSKDIFGKSIGFYSEATELITGGKKRKGDPFTAKDTGDFLKGIYANVFKDNVLFGSSDPKTDDILDSPDWLSNDLFGLTDENLKEVIENKILPFVLMNYRKELGL